MAPQFADRSDAGRALADALGRYRHHDGLLVLGLARGGMPVAWEVADALDADLDVLVVRKIRAPGNPELALGAVAAGGIRILNEDIIAALGVDEDTLDAATHTAREELEAREQEYRAGRAPLPVAGRTVIVVDDGVATGASLRAALLAVRQLHPAALIAAVPVSSTEARRKLARIVDEFVVLSVPAWFAAVSQCYRRFDQTPDEEVRRLLESRAQHRQTVSVQPTTPR